MVIPPQLVRHATTVWGDAGRQWLDGLPTLLDAIADRWQLEPGEPFELSYHWVTAVTRADGRPAVLKVGVPTSEHLRVEAAALRAWDGNGAVRLLGYDPDRGALLLERADPGTRAATLVSTDDTAATGALIAVMHALHATAPPADCVPDLRGLADDFAAYLHRFPDGGPLPVRWVTTAARLFDELCDSAPARVLLHGDLHHDNVLRAARRPWLAIDPHGYVGDPGFDLGTLLYNPDPGATRPDETIGLLPARLEQMIAEAGQPAERVIAWCFVTAVLSEVWTCEDGGDPDGKPLAVASALEPQL